MNFNFVAPFYDFLSRLVFQNQLKKAQVYYLNNIKSGDHILLPGGGTGWILEELDKLKISLRVSYVEPSSKMMLYSKARKTTNLNITFIEKELLSHEQSEPVDVVITFFFLDLFEEDLLIKTIKYLEKSLKPRGIWLYSDFQLMKESSRIHRLLIKLMICFFRVFAGLKATRLLNHKQHIIDRKIIQKDNHSWMNGLIQSTVFEK